MDKTIEKIIMGRIMETKGTEIWVHIIQVKTAVSLGKDTEVIHRTDLIQEIDTVIMIENQSRGRQRFNSNDRENSRTRSRLSSQVSTNRDRLRCYRCSEYDHFARECPNALTDESSDEVEGATLQMLTQDETPVLDYLEMELNGDLNM